MKRIALLLIALLGILLLIFLDRYQIVRWQEGRNFQLTKEAHLTQIRLQNALQSRINTTQYLASLISLHPDTDEEEFRSFAESLMEYNPSVRALQLADEDTQVIYVYPTKGNEITISEPMVLIEDPLRGTYVKKAIEEQRMTIQPPFKLRQGGIGMVARNPIFLSNRCIGLAIAVLDVPVLIEEAFYGITESNYLLSLTDSEGNTFYHELPEDAPFVERTVSFADTEWKLRLAYKNYKAPPPSFSRLLILALGGGFLILLLFIIWFLRVRTQHLESEVARRLEELSRSETRFRIIANYTVDWEYWIDPEGKILYNSPSVTQISGYSKDSFPTGGDILDTLVHPEDKEKFQDHLQPREESALKKEEKLSFRILTKGGEVKWLGHYCQAVYNDEDQYVGRRASNRDITEQKQLEQRLEQTIEEKDILMKELNHRVKNNLIMINSLINLKEGSAGGTIDLSDITHQIDAIRIIHEKLYKSDSITHINFKDYVEELLSTIFSFYQFSVTIETNIAIETLTTRTSIPLGLIINEIATNTIKYGFKPQQSAHFSISMVQDSESQEYVLTISNNGYPFPEDIDLNNPNTLGLRLITLLVTQIDGTMDLQKSPNPVFTIRFPVKSSN